MAKGVFVFDGEGNFLFQIGKLGQGPGEYTSISDFSIDTQQRLIYILDHHAVEAHVYMLDKGEYVKSIRLDGNNSRSFHLEVCDSSIYMDAYYPSGTSNKEKYMLCRTNMNNEQKVFWLNCLDYNLGWDQIHFVSPIFYNQLDGNGVKFVQPFMHTVMNITHNGVQPYLRLQSKNWITQTDLNETEGDASVRYINLSQKNRINNINSVFEFGNYLFLKYDEGGRMNYLFYDKSTANLSHSSTFVNDLLYEDTNTSGVNLNFCFADSTGLYGYIHPFSMERLLQARDAGNISDRIDNQLHHLTSESNPVLFYLSTPR
jgi:hypothetical protein